MTTVSVVIPCYNAALYLPEALESVRRQSRRPDEVIIVDDGSTDASAAIARAHDVTLLRTAGNRGPSAARNAGVGAARGEVIAFLDADDYWDPTHLETVMQLLDAHPQAAVASSRVRYVGGEHEPHVVPFPERVPADALLPLLRRNLLVQSVAAVRRSALAEVGGYDESMRHSEDYDLWLRLAQRHPFVWTFAVTGSYRVHEEQASRWLPNLLEGAWNARHRIWRAATETGSPEYLREVEAALREAWEQSMEDAWGEHNRVIIEFALSLHRFVPRGSPLYPAWQRRVRYLWPAWDVAYRVWGRVPEKTRQRIRFWLRNGSAGGDRADAPIDAGADNRAVRGGAARSR